MKPTSRSSRRHWLGLGVMAAAVLAHELLLRLLANSSAAAQWLSPGGHSSTVALAAIGGLLALRLTLLVALPATAIAWLVLTLTKRLQRRS